MYHHAIGVPRAVVWATFLLRSSVEPSAAGITSCRERATRLCGVTCRSDCHFIKAHTQVGCSCRRSTNTRTYKSSWIKHCSTGSTYDTGNTHTLMELHCCLICIVYEQQQKNTTDSSISERPFWWFLNSTVRFFCLLPRAIELLTRG
ncbi:unnamed protein product [Sphacelaria rigidula]